MTASARRATTSEPLSIGPDSLSDRADRDLLATRIGNGPAL